MLINTTLEILEGWGKLTATEIGLLAKDQKAQDRLVICKGCPLLQESQLCTSCYCYMPAKVLVQKSFCPIGKW